MEQPTKVIVLHATKYGETSVILNAYTQQLGLRAYVVNGVRSAKRKKTFSMGMFQPLTQLAASCPCLALASWVHTTNFQKP